ncbi:peptidogalycan biosysnthesis protein [Prochlorococcus sp. MIT 1341]|uniref:peptidogalycan biosysnthesis protein n=1 Tax=Prochlorococcus sp. MIT 1341 TaxID=3096221 RepID=UPI002A752373|nr:peptidogalycan biosysnthesis protein [Prochlorococcus sp. MIT 1341]
MKNISINWYNSISDIEERHLYKLLGENVIPFYRSSWLSLLESSGSITSSEGWQPCHLVVRRGSLPIAFAPLYLKIHSYGEFVFDQSFAQLANDMGLSYYPKLLGMSPLSPVEGYRFFILPEEDMISVTKLMINAIDEFAISNQILSCNFLYVDSEWGQLLESLGWSQWFNQQSIWLRNQKKSFDEYLAMFNANQRRNIKRERSAIIKAGIKVTPLTGAELDVDLMGLMYCFYEQHCSRWGHWGSKYLAKAFFEALAQPQHRDQIVLFSAHFEDPRLPVGMALCVTDGNDLWGRYWGAKEEIEYLHFEACYYSPIEWALKNNIKSFSPGAGGSHKHRRGFQVLPRVSLHRWYQNDFDALLRSWVKKVNTLMLNEIDAVNAELPFEIEDHA